MEQPADNFNIESLPQDEQDAIRSQWLNRFFKENPQDLSLREKLLPKTGGLSFANVVHTENIESPSALDRKIILELIFQHLQAIGFNKTADTLEEETRHKFQHKNQPWERTDLHLLISMAVGSRDNAWELEPDSSFLPILEYIDEDLFSSPYEEDYLNIWDEIINKKLQYQLIDPKKPPCLENLKCASLKAIVYFAVNSTVTNDTARQNLFLTMHSITTSQHFLQHLIALYNGRLKNGTPVPNVSELKTIQVYTMNFLKKWIDYLGLYTGKSTLKRVSQFLTKLSQDSSTLTPISNISNSLLKVLSTLTFGHRSGLISDIYNPIIPNYSIIFNPNLSVIDPEPIEIARQMTLIAHKEFSGIPPLELFALLSEGSISLKTHSITQFLKVSEKMAILTIESLLSATKPYETIRKILEISKELLNIGNFDTLGFLISILKRQEFLNILKTNLKLEDLEEINKLLKQSGEDEKSVLSHPSPYEDVIMQRTQRKEPTIPNFRATLVNIDRKMIKENDFIDGNINSQKRQSIGKWMNQIYELQNLYYHFCPVPQIQRVLQEQPKFTISQLAAAVQKINIPTNK